MSPILSVKSLNLSFGGIKALKDVNIEIQPNQFVSLIGPNGAGKTTLFNCVSRIYEIDQGEITLKQKNITKAKRYHLSRLGVSRTYQNVALFPNLTVLQNVSLGLFSERGGRIDLSDDRIKLIVDEFGLNEIVDSFPGELSYGNLKKVELARALVSQPTLVLLDEPAAGLNHNEGFKLAQIIKAQQRKLGFSVLMVEHHMQMVMSVSDLVIVMESGEVIAQGTPSQVQENPRVIEAYLGTGG